MSKKGSAFNRLIEQRNEDEPMPSDAFDTGEDNELLAALRNIRNPGQALATIDSNEVRIGAFLCTSIGIKIEGEITRSDWDRTGKLLHLLDQSMQWLIGDFIVRGVDLGYGDQVKIAELFGFEYGTVRVYASVARNVDLLIRINSLSFAHHQLVASLSPAKQKHWLARAEQGDDGTRWSVARLRAEIAASKNPALPSMSDRLAQIRKAETKKAESLVKDGASREAVARIYEQIAEDIRSSK